MSDRYTQITRLPIAGQLVKQLGLPQPVELDRWQPGRPVIDGPVLFGGAPGGRHAAAIAKVLANVGAEVHTALDDEVRPAVADAGIDAKVLNDDQRFKALVFDASGIQSTGDLRALYDFFHPTIRRVLTSGRVIVLGGDDGVAQRALEGFTRAVGKEVKRGASSNLIYAEKGADLESTLRFFLSPRSAYVSGQVARLSKAPVGKVADWDRPLAGKVAVVTGAGRGIGASIAEVLERDGADVIRVDMAGDDVVELDITAPDAPKQFADMVEGGVDIVVHNAGITRDKTLGRMSEDQWAMTIDVNVSAPERINAELLKRDLLNEQGRIVGVSSISGIAGNAGQTNYSTSKAAVIGAVQTLAPAFAERQATINAVAPGFIETQMTAAMPIGLREAGRRMNSMSQGGLPLDVAETIAWFASPASGAVNGNVVRVCGQSLIGA
jgi:3-oxoacyl-[acyl-carrier protein] reductase